jgi:hypothetical protein
MEETVACPKMELFQLNLTVKTFSWSPNPSPRGAYFPKFGTNDVPEYKASHPRRPIHFKYKRVV